MKIPHFLAVLLAVPCAAVYFVFLLFLAQLPSMIGRCIAVLLAVVVGAFLGYVTAKHGLVDAYDAVEDLPGSAFESVFTSNGIITVGMMAILATFFVLTQGRTWMIILFAGMAFWTVFAAESHFFPPRRNPLSSGAMIHEKRGGPRAFSVGSEQFLFTSFPSVGALRQAFSALPWQGLIRVNP